MNFSHILFEAGGEGLALITVNRVEKRNALTRAVIGELDEVFRQVERDRGIGGLVLTGAGEKAFVAGADVAELSGLSGLEARELSLFGQSAFRRLETMGKPSVAALNGYCLGGGLELAMCCTVRFAVKEAVLGQPEVKLGLMPGYGATVRLPQLVGRGRALEMLLSGEAVTAEEALRMGLVNRVVERAELLDVSQAWLRAVRANGPVAAALVMDAVDRGYDTAGFGFEAAAFGVAAGTEDAREGMRAFLEKRAAVFTGK